MAWSLDRASHVPLHAQLERLLRELAATPEHRAGARMPDELSLAKELGVSRNTVRTAIERMVAEGILERRRGVGTHVTRPAVADHRAEWTRFIEELEPRGDLVQIASATASHQVAGAEPALALGLAAETVVVRLERVLSSPDGPLGRLRSWFHPRVALTGQEDFRRPLWEVIERDLGAIPTAAHEEIAAVAADAELARALVVSRNTPVLLRRRVVLDSQGRPLEFALGWYRADRAKRQIRLLRDPRS